MRLARHANLFAYLIVGQWTAASGTNEKPLLAFVNLLHLVFPLHEKIVKRRQQHADAQNHHLNALLDGRNKRDSYDRNGKKYLYEALVACLRLATVALFPKILPPLANTGKFVCVIVGVVLYDVVRHERIPVVALIAKPDDGIFLYADAAHALVFALFIAHESAIRGIEIFKHPLPAIVDNDACMLATYACIFNGEFLSALFSYYDFKCCHAFRIFRGCFTVWLLRHEVLPLPPQTVCEAIPCRLSATTSACRACRNAIGNRKASGVASTH